MIASRVFITKHKPKVARSLGKLIFCTEPDDKHLFFSVICLFFFSGSLYSDNDFSLAATQQVFTHSDETQRKYYAIYTRPRVTRRCPVNRKKNNKKCKLSYIGWQLANSSLCGAASFLPFLALCRLSSTTHFRHFVAYFFFQSRDILISFFFSVFSLAQKHDLLTSFYTVFIGNTRWL